MESKNLKIAALVLLSIVAAFILFQVVSKTIEEETIREKARAEARAKVVEKIVEKAVERKAEFEVDIQSCIDKGGVPVRTLFTGRLKRCDFPKGKQ